MNTKEIDRLAREWLLEAGGIIKQEVAECKYQISEKTGPSDLVTSVDKKIEKFFAKKIAEFFPTHQLVAEEDDAHKFSTFKGVTWILDPIDGTLNFVQQQANYAISLGIFEENHGQLAYVFDVERGSVYSCIVGEGVFVDNVKVERLRVDPSLEESLLIMNFGIIASNYLNLADAGRRARAVRLYGVASLEMMAVIVGQADGYISRSLMPWDIAAGYIMAKELNLEVTRIDGSEINVLETGSLMIASKEVHQTLSTDYIKKTEIN
ncbi:MULTISPECIES: inositol monophosphatase family protein [Brochothrix]|uniref:Inositol monophosphatase n=1 Tax=Brochothrix thermosphacta TaxID=2756 RepID=A0A1D2K4R8_BROTH|nr:MULTISPECIES: inositol monophosphatase family protein [Brochothrix]ANZ95773.1 hypothetical protein BFC19_10475 [Brochothrix thermosphacta]ATF25317.1 inositol monophosphatase [Brochothrix thermosphacta]ATH84700.1 inositol monophosphatase [Brochothrix thermosphacta]MBR5526651.1 inositol monophosphatase family protein [Brochothrix sp.]MPQ27752.1 inositol monophosphatase family protein [Brochothrix thermosphacta]